MESESRAQMHTLSSVSNRTSLSRSALYREIKAGRLRTVKIGRALRVTETEIDRFISEAEARGGSAQ